MVICNVNFYHNTNCSWGKIKHGFSQGTVRGPWFFLLYDLQNFVNNKSKKILFAYDSSIIVTTQILKMICSISLNT